MVASVHHRSVHLLGSRNREDAASAGVEQRVVLECGNRLRHGIERIAAGGENVAADAQRAAQTLMIRRRSRAGRLVLPERSGTAVDGERKTGVRSG